MSPESLGIGISIALTGALLTIVGTLMIRSNNRTTESNKALELIVTAAKTELAKLVTEVAVQGANHSHVAERLAINETAVASAHKRLDQYGDRIVRLETYQWGGNPEVR